MEGQDDDAADLNLNLNLAGREGGEEDEDEEGLDLNLAGREERNALAR